MSAIEILRHLLGSPLYGANSGLSYGPSAADRSAAGPRARNEYGKIPLNVRFASYFSNAKMRFQSSFMLITVQAFLVASASSVSENVPTLVFGSPLAGP
jgi:hypothetical protein